MQDSLGGNAKTQIIANVSPSNICSAETLSTLYFVQRAKCIRNKATINLDYRWGIVHSACAVCSMSVLPALSSSTL